MGLKTVAAAADEAEADEAEAAETDAAETDAAEADAAEAEADAADADAADADAEAAEADAASKGAFVAVAWACHAHRRSGLICIRAMNPQVEAGAWTRVQGTLVGAWLQLMYPNDVFGDPGT